MRSLITWSGEIDSGGPAGAAGTLLFLSRGRTTAMLGGLRGDGKKPFSEGSLADLTGTLAKRISRASR